MRDFTIDSSAVSKKLQDLATSMPWIIDALLLELAKAIRAAARDIVPIKSGHLRRSIRYKRNPDGSVNIFASTRWGNVTREYAAAVHENLEARHADGKSAKYIERPLMTIGYGEASERIGRELLRRFANYEKFKGTWKVILDDDGE